MSDPVTLAAAFDIFNRVRVQSLTLENIWKAGFGDQYAKDAKPNAFYTQAVLDQIVTALHSLESDGILLDVGTGHGGPGIYIARKLSMKLLGIDISPIGVEMAQNAARASGFTDAEFKIADAASTGLTDGSCAAAVCLDVMIYFPDKASALEEIVRVLKPGGMFAFTTWEQTGFNSRLGAKQVGDHRPLLRAAGFEVLVYNKMADAERAQLRMFQELIGHEKALREELGDETASMLVNMARSGQRESEGRTYVLGIARRIAGL
jgi:ubiquinone/menaquinone biosynthesis C-methylase UbiE